MVNVAYAAPYVPEVPEVFTPWKGIKHTWTGWDGSVWDLSDPDGGVFLLADGLEGLHMPQIVHYVNKSPVVHGSETVGWIVDGRDVFWNLGVFADNSSVEWIRLNRAFWKTLRPGKTGVWRIELPTGEAFSLTLRLADTQSHMHATDPVERGWDVVPLKLHPDQPLWEGLPVIKRWESGEQFDWYGGPDGGPPFYVSPSSQLASAVVTNTGDVESYAKWRITGPTDTVQVGVGSDVTVVNFVLLAGMELVLDSDPRTLTALLDGVNVMEHLPDFGPPPIPPGEDIALGLAMDGTGTVQVEFTPLHLMGV